MTASRPGRPAIMTPAHDSVDESLPLSEETPSEAPSAESNSPSIWQDPYAAWEREAKMDAKVPGKVTELKSMNFDGVDLDAALKEYYLDRVEEKFIPRHDKPVIKHPLNDYDYEGVVDAIKEHWLAMGCQTNNGD